MGGPRQDSTLVNTLNTFSVGKSGKISQNLHKFFQKFSIKNIFSGGGRKGVRKGGREGGRKGERERGREGDRGMD